MAEDEKTSKETEAEAKTAVGMQAVDKIIADFESINRAIKQKNKFAETLAHIDGLIKHLKENEKIQYRIKFICAIKPDVLAAVSITKGRYADAQYKFSRLIDFFRDVIHERPNFYKEIDYDELSKIREKINFLLQLLEDNIEYGRGNAEELQSNTDRTKDVIEIIFRDVRKRIREKEIRREKEQETVGDLNEQADFSEKNSKKYKYNARCFLAGTVIIVAVIACLPYFYFDATITEVEKAKEYIYFYIALKTIFSARTLLSVTLLVMLFASIRFYASSYHNAVVCDQRANTLRSYQSLRNAATTDTEKHLVLQKILDAATDHQPSGFTKEDKVGDSPIEKALATLISVSNK